MRPYFLPSRKSPLRGGAADKAIQPNRSTQEINYLLQPADVTVTAGLSRRVAVDACHGADSLVSCWINSGRMACDRNGGQLRDGA